MHCQGTRVSLRILEPPKMHKTIENVSVFNTAIKFNPLSIKLNLVSRVSINVQNIVFSSSYVKMSSQNCLRFRVTIVFFGEICTFDDKIALRTFFWIEFFFVDFTLSKK